MIDFFDLHPFYEGSETLATITKGSTLQQIRMKKKIFTPYNRCQIFFIFLSVSYFWRGRCYIKKPIYFYDCP